MKASTLVVGAFIFIVYYLMGIEQGAITNSPVDCLCDAATSVSEAIGTEVPRQIPITRSTKKGAFVSENKSLDLSFEFAVAIVNLVDSVTALKSSFMTDQLARAGTSVGANIHESQYAQSEKISFRNWRLH